LPIFLGVSIKWLVRIFLVGFYALFGFYQLHGQNPFGWLASDHPWLTITLILVTCYAFLSPIVTLRKETVGGEVTMRKATWLFVFIIACLILTIMYYANFPRGFQPAVNKHVLGTISTSTSGVLLAIYANPIWKVYFAPTRWAYVWGLASMAVVAFIALRFVKPQVQKIHIPVIHKTVTPTYSSGSTMQSSTPQGATLRPETTQTVVEEIVEEEAEAV
jgi:hypothetical protein